ncbi:similar to capsular polysaccharide biosynthsis protein [Paracholeplasma brassicae]|uniref:Similar to capsular polysaccharide biosynthsis protein n=1 Tax=Acholeplasma brassicae TaxID=61635 RepID=U4KM80_9MOLU|nr:glycosyltransferase [Paracholeplasma brassicae]CCV65106.1 similar to capsular polysaccharide biosynthsis protein [Paracholeplasma brassicae]
MKKAYISINNFLIGGVETSLVSFINILMKDYDVTLEILGKYDENMIRRLDKSIKLRFPNKSIRKYVDLEGTHRKNTKGLSDIILKIVFYITNKIKLSKLLYLAISFRQKDEIYYDLAISYTGRPGIWDYLLLSTIKSRLYLSWIHNDPNKLGIKSHHYKVYYSKYDIILCVSMDSLNKIKKILLKMTSLNFKFSIIQLIMKDYLRCLNKKIIEHDSNVFTILTVARIQNSSKRIDRIVDVASMLIDNNITSFKWYVLGDGPDYEEILNQVRNRNLKNYLIFKGSCDNPYPYFKNADLFVLTSDYEGLPVVLMEARHFKLPILTTNIDSASEMVNHMIDGVISEKNVVNLYEWIKKIITEPDFYGIIRQNSLTHKGYNNNDLSEFHKIIRGLSNEE